MSSDYDRALAAVRASVRRLDIAQHARIDAIRRARLAGCTMKDISEASGITERALYRLVARHA